MTEDLTPRLVTALRRRDFLLTLWPWRALVYLVTTTPMIVVPAIGLLVAAGPLLATVNAARNDRPVSIPLMLFLTACTLGVLSLTPLVAMPIAAIERRRLRLVDHVVAEPAQRLPLSRRYLSSSTWREAALLLCLAVVAPAALAMIGLLAMLTLLLIASPWVAGRDEPISVIWTTASTPAGAIPYAVAGVLLVPLLGYLVGGLAAAQAVVTRGLLAEGPESLRELTHSRSRLVNAYEAERQRIERDLHDAAQPRLTSLALQLGLARVDVPGDSPAAVPLERAHDQAKGLMLLMRQIVHGIRPQSLTDLGLAGAVRELAELSPIPVTVRAELTRSVPPVTETTAFYAVSEALSNVARHSSARTVEVSLTNSGRRLIVEVLDDGQGGADPDRGTGLTGLADRIAASDGRLLLSSPVGGPTRLRVELPCQR